MPADHWLDWQELNLSQVRRKTLIFPLHHCPQHPLVVGNTPSLHPLKLRGGSPTSSGRNSVGCQEQLQPTHPCPLKQGSPGWGSAPLHHSSFRPLFSHCAALFNAHFIHFLCFLPPSPPPPSRAPGKANTGLPGTINQWQHLPSSFVKQALHWALKPKAGGKLMP